jgi:hypothetical protein
VLNAIRLILLIIAMGISIYGFAGDNDLVAFAGVSIFIIATMLREIIKAINH